MFSDKTFSFLTKLEQNNNREWFDAHKLDYENQVRTPALDFISQMAKPLAKIAPLFIADPRKMGGSLMRVYRDTRFSKDKTPYKTNIGIQFRHNLGKDVHAPGFYVHIANDECFWGVGSWHPEPELLYKIRTLIAQNSNEWLTIITNPSFKKFYELSGDSLKRMPLGLSNEHLAANDLRRKDFIGISTIKKETVLGKDFVKETTSSFERAIPFMKFLCKAAEVKF